MKEHIRTNVGYKNNMKEHIRTNIYIDVGCII